MAFSVGDAKEVVLLLSFLECRSFILKGRAGFEYIGEQILPARSALEFIRADLSGIDLGKVEAFDTFIKANPDQFDKFFQPEFHWLNREAALDDWVWNDNGETPAVPESHWWWKPLGDDQGEA